MDLASFNLCGDVRICLLGFLSKMWCYITEVICDHITPEIVVKSSFNWATNNLRTVSGTARLYFC